MLGSVNLPPIVHDRFELLAVQPVSAGGFGSVYCVKDLYSDSTRQYVMKCPKRSGAKLSQAQVTAVEYSQVLATRSTSNGAPRAQAGSFLLYWALCRQQQSYHTELRAGP